MTASLFFIATDFYMFIVHRYSFGLTLTLHETIGFLDLHYYSLRVEKKKKDGWFFLSIVYLI